MSDEDFEKCLSTLRKSGTEIDILILTGGEPTAHPKLIEFLERCYEKDFIHRVGVATNGIKIAPSAIRDQSLADPDLCRKVRQVRVATQCQIEGRSSGYPAHGPAHKLRQQNKKLPCHPAV